MKSIEGWDMPLSEDPTCLLLNLIRKRDHRRFRIRFLMSSEIVNLRSPRFRAGDAFNRFQYERPEIGILHGLPAGARFCSSERDYFQIVRSGLQMAGGIIAVARRRDPGIRGDPGADFIPVARPA